MYFFNCNEMSILILILIKLINDDDPDTIILIRLWAWHIRFEKRKAFKKELDERLMHLAWHSNRW